jgi:hypothetical protein
MACFQTMKFSLDSHQLKQICVRADEELMKLLLLLLAHMGAVDTIGVYWM